MGGILSCAGLKTGARHLEQRALNHTCVQLIPPIHAIAK